MVAAKNRMFRTQTGRIITVQDAAKAGLIDPNDIPTVGSRKDYASDAEYEAAREKAIAFRDKLVEQMSGKDREKLLDAAGDRVGYKINRDIKQEIKSEEKAKTTGVNLKRPSNKWTIEEMVEAGVFSVNDVELKNGSYQLKERTAFSSATGKARNPYPELESLNNPQTIARLKEAREMLGTSPPSPLNTDKKGKNKPQKKQKNNTSPKTDEEIGRSVGSLPPKYASLFGEIARANKNKTSQNYKPRTYVQGKKEIDRGLKVLEEKGLISRSKDGEYVLTPEGRKGHTFMVKDYKVFLRQNKKSKRQANQFLQDLNRRLPYGKT